ncbi:Cytoskeleton protein RodZ [Nymphon striatum]|nr:Cytoskeleton protein RodZ [Nymphon striatum]
MAKKIKETEVVEVQTGELGNLLQQYRESIGFSVTQTADALCLSEHTITQLENEAFESLAEPPYIRGYLRNYAKLVEKDPSELISLYENLRGASPDELEHYFKPSPSARRKSSWLPLLALIVAGLMALFSIPNIRAWFTNTWQSFSQQTNEPNGTLNNNNPLLTGNMPAPLPIPRDENKTNTEKQEIGNNSSKSDNNTKKEKNNSSKETNSKALASIPPLPSDIFPDKKLDKSDTDKKESNEITNKVSTNTKEASPESSDPSSTSDTVKVKLVFNKEVWLRIKDKNKKTVYEGQTQAGNEKELELKKPLTFRIGNAQGISIFIDGKPKDIAEFIKGSVANFTVP